MDGASVIPHLIKDYVACFIIQARSAGYLAVSESDLVQQHGMDIQGSPTIARSFIHSLVDRVSAQQAFLLKAFGERDGCRSAQACCAGRSLTGH